MKPCRKPCKTCPWRVDQDASVIPGFDLDKAENLAATCPDEKGHGPEFGSPMFACHQSREGDEIVCAGWLAVHGSAHPNARMMGMMQELPVEAFEPPPDIELEPDFKAVIEKLRRTV